MIVKPDPDDDDDDGRMRRAAAGDAAAWDEIFSPHRGRLRRIVALRLDRRLWGRVDPSDVLQEAAIEALRQLPRYAEGPGFHFFLWLRWLTGRTLQTVHRKHLGVRSREAGREVRFAGAAMPEATSAALAAQLVGKDTRPSFAAARAERRLRIEQALDELDPVDREILVLRHFEELTPEEAARLLGVSRAAASKRYFRAVRRLKVVIEDMPGGEEGFRL